MYLDHWEVPECRYMNTIAPSVTLSSRLSARYLKLTSRWPARSAISRAGDNFRLCTDMRDARTNRRATRYCQQFFFLPTGGGRGGKSPVAETTKIKRAREDAPQVAAERIEGASHVTKSGYDLEAHLPARCLGGFDPDEHSRIGFYYILEDGDFGQQYLTVGDDLYWFVDPSTWATAVLERPAPQSPAKRRPSARKRSVAK